jgi:hypothetical protein
MAKRAPKSAPQRTLDAEPAPAERARAAESIRPPGPMALSSLFGQSRAASVLTDAVRCGRVHHAWIFYGPSGIGKRAAAGAFASLLLDPTTAEGLSGELGPDPDSAAQKLLEAGTHPDLHYLVKEMATFSREDSVRNSKQKVIGTDLVLEFLVEPLQRTGRAPAGARAGKVAIVDDADLMSIEAQNRLLKTLEEPGEGTVLILVTSAEDRLLPTIRSRCQRVYFAPLSRADMDRWIARSAIDIPPADLAWLRDFAEGSPGALIEARDAGLTNWWSTLVPMLEASARGQHVAALGPAMEAIAKSHAEAVHERSGKSASKEAANRAASDMLLKLIAHWARQRLRTALSGGGEVDRVSMRTTDLIREAEAQADANVNLLFVFEKLSAELAAIGAVASKRSLSPAR